MNAKTAKELLPFITFFAEDGVIEFLWEEAKSGKPEVWKKIYDPSWMFPANRYRRAIKESKLSLVK